MWQCRSSWKALARPKRFLDIDFHADTDDLPSLVSTFLVETLWQGTFNGVAFWFDLHIDESSSLTSGPFTDVVRIKDESSNLISKRMVTRHQTRFSLTGDKLGAGNPMDIAYFRQIWWLHTTIRYKRHLQSQICCRCLCQHYCWTSALPLATVVAFTTGEVLHLNCSDDTGEWLAPHVQSSVRGLPGTWQNLCQYSSCFQKHRCSSYCQHAARDACSGQRSVRESHALTSIKDGAHIILARE